MFWVFKKTVEGTLNIAERPIYNNWMAVTFIPVRLFLFDIYVIIQRGHFS